MTKSLWVRQTAYTVVVVAVVAVALTGTEVVSSYHAERTRLQEFGNHLIGSFHDAAARAAFHVDQLQAEAVVEGLMNFEELQYVDISTDLNAVLARRTRQHDESGEDSLAAWLFSDVTKFERALTVDRSELMSTPSAVLKFGLIPPWLGTFSPRMFDPASLSWPLSSSFWERLSPIFSI
jgi:hypothetical protein